MDAEFASEEIPGIPATFPSEARSSFSHGLAPGIWPVKDDGIFT